MGLRANSTAARPGLLQVRPASGGRRSDAGSIMRCEILSSEWSPSTPSVLDVGRRTAGLSEPRPVLRR